MQLEIKGNPGQGNRFEETNVEHADHVYPNAKTVIHNNYSGNGGNRIRPAAITAIINKLSDPSLLPPTLQTPDTTLYDIQPKIVFNSLCRWEKIIRRYALWTAEVDKIYKEFDSQARSKSDAVLNWLNRQYEELHETYEADLLFDQLKKRVYDVVNNDPSCKEDIAMEELDENVCIVLVDAFMKCRIFEKPIL